MGRLFFPSRHSLRLFRSSWAAPSFQRLLSTQVEAKPFYITTPIFYVNADPHVGHMYSMVLADILKRFQTLQGRTAYLSTGVDEHGLKIQKAAKALDLTPQQLCDRSAQTFKRLAEQANISNDMFVRTTGAEHVAAVVHAWDKLKDAGHIYQTAHEGWYCVSDETFYPESSVRKQVDPITGLEQMMSTETGKTVEWASEVNYKFRLSDFQDKLLKFYAENPQWIEPKQKMSMVVREVENGLTDLSVSRPSERVQWGIPVPSDSSQTIYVWLDALLNYAVQAGYPWSTDKTTTGGWPANVQIIGKDIIRFHCIYWPAFLMALGLELPRKFLCHAYWTLGQEKMSKSVGNVVNPFTAMDLFGRDAIRWYMAYDGGIVDDASYSNEMITTRYEQLKNVLGNFVSRLTKAKNWSVPREVSKTFEAGIQKQQPSSKLGKELVNRIANVRSQVQDALDQANPRIAAHAVFELIAHGNSTFAHFEPWKLGIKNDPEGYPAEGREAIYLSAETLRISGILLQPFMPDKAAMLLDTLGVKEERRTWECAELGADDEYGTSKHHEKVLFPPLVKTN
jgi:methionyl-tRNA synthetase